MDRRDLQLPLIQALLAAPGSQEGWHTFLLLLCDAVNGTAANFISHSLSSNTADVSVTARTDPDALALYTKHWHQFDPWAHSPIASRLHSGSIVVGDQLIGSNEMKRTAYYADFGCRYGIVQCIAGMIEVSPRALSCVSINGGNERKPFDNEDVGLLQSLMPHLERALQIHRRLAGAELMAADVTEVLNRLPHGVLLISSSGALLFANRAADDILRMRDGLNLDHGDLRASTPSLTNVLRAVLKSALNTNKGIVDGSSSMLALPRPSGRRPLSVVMAPLPQRRIELGPQTAAVAVIVTDPDRTPLPGVDVIRSMFHLTRGEARLVRYLIEGYNLEQAATTLGLRLGTVRSRLKTVFQKTDTHRQADLVRVVLAGASTALA